MKKHIALALICSVLLCGCGVPDSSDNVQSGSSVSTEADSTIYTVDDFCRNLDTESGFARKHGDECFTITGEIENNSDVFLGNVYLHSSFESDTWHAKYQVTCEFEDDDALDDLGKGDVVTITGKLFSVATSGIVLQDCELVSEERKDSNPTSDSETTEPTNQAESVSETDSDILVGSSEENSTSSTDTNGIAESSTPSTSSAAGSVATSTAETAVSTTIVSTTAATTVSATTTTPTTATTAKTTPTTPVETPQSRGVYIAASGNGKKYHWSAYCSGMDGNVIEMSKEDAEAAGYTPCKKKSCYG